MTWFECELAAPASNASEGPHATKQNIPKNNTASEIKTLEKKSNQSTTKTQKGTKDENTETTQRQGNSLRRAAGYSAEGGGKERMLKGNIRKRNGAPSQ
jgi:hypothetical protein